MCVGFSELNGSWKTYCTWRLYWRNRWLLPTSTGLPSSLTDPWVGRSCPASSLATVDLPEPLSPTSATTAPRYRPNDTFLAACSTAPRPSLKSLPRPTASSASGPRAAATDSTTAGSPTCSASALTAGAADASLTGTPLGRLVEAGTPLMIGSVMTAPLPG